MCSAAQQKLPPEGGPVSLFQQSLAERLHDGPLQELVALQLRAATLARLTQLTDVERDERLSELGGLAQTAMESLQQVIRDLMGEATKPTPLLPRLTELCDQFRAGSGIDCRLLVVPDHVRFDPSVSEILFRTVRELLTNVRKHSQATTVKITSRLKQLEAIAITVADNGVGLQSTTRRKHPFEGGGFGLWSIEHRLGELGGKLEIASDSGLRATVILPRKHLVAD
jgi:signal transduction histidine kinase